MPDSFPHDVRPPDDDRAAKIEELLVTGLDHYFAGEHERAISVWTRVLFLDRGHARARAYIERARGAQAERQRESEALIEQGLAAFNEGDTALARELLSSAVARGGPHDVALTLLERLSRLAAPARLTLDHGPAEEGRRRLTRQAVSEPRRPRSWLLAAGLLALAVVAVAIGVALSFPDLLSSPGGVAGRAPARPPQEVLPLPRSADLALGRARVQASAGHLKDALATLESIGPGDPAHPDAERLRADIQASLLAGVPPLEPPK